MTACVSAPMQSSMMRSPNYLDERFSPLKRVTKGSDENQLSDELIDLCLSFIPETVFASTLHFLNFFKNRNFIFIPANIPFKIYSYLPADADCVQEITRAVQRTNPIKAFETLLNQILALIGKTGRFHFLDQTNTDFLRYKFTAKVISVELTSNLVYMTQKTDILVHSRDIFETMIRFSVFKLSLVPNQKMVFVDTAEECVNDHQQCINQSKWKEYIPKGYSLNWDRRIQDAVVSHWTNRVATVHMLQIFSPEGVGFSLTKLT